MEHESDLTRWAEKWKEEKNQTVKATTLAAYNLSLHKYILPHFKNIEDLSNDLINNFVVTLKKNRLTIKSIRDIVMVLKMLAKFLEKNGLVDYKELNFNIPKEDSPKKVKVLTYHQQRVLSQYLNEHSSVRNIGILLSLHTGMRIGEICGLKWGDFDFEMGSVTINRTIYRIYNPQKDIQATRLISSTPKTRNSRRCIPLPENLLKMIFEIRPKHSAKFYFLTGSTRPLEPHAYRIYYSKVLKQLGLPSLKFHSLRHTFATRCIECDCDCKTVSEILGHADISTTLNLYMHPSHDQKRRCIEKMLSSLDDRIP